ncbi:MAG: hypothetical protein MZW92_75915 [Comamonadaceae bacterium]|nr:hypothetical protein [Comamonadaceae bacterium]
MDERIHTLPDGSLAVLIGSPHGKTVLAEVQDDPLSGDFELLRDGRVILLRCSARMAGTGQCGTTGPGSIPGFSHAEIGQGRIASTAEPATAQHAAAYTPDDFFLPGLVSLLMNGHSDLRLDPLQGDEDRST